MTSRFELIFKKISENNLSKKMADTLIREERES